MGEQSRETLVSSIFSSNGAQQYFMNETEYHASFYCRNSGGTSFFKGPLSYADSWAYCENHDGTLGEFYRFSKSYIVQTIFFDELPCYCLFSNSRVRKNQPDRWIF